jgi:hypothetical protein
LAFTKKSMSKPDETRKFGKGGMKVAKLPEHTFGLVTFRPGWRWSNDLKPIAKTESCQMRHVGYMISGKMAGVLDDGTKWSVKKGDVMDLPAGHDAWVVGKENVVILDISSAATYAKQ